MDGERVGVGVGRVGRQGQMQAAVILIEGDPARAHQLHALHWPREYSPFSMPVSLDVREYRKMSSTWYCCAQLRSAPVIS